MASLLQKLTKKQSHITALFTNNFSKRILTSSTHTKPEPATPIPFFFFNGGRKTCDEANVAPHSMTFYPNFSFEGFLNPISQIGFVSEEKEDIVSGYDGGMIWADSVKKKRKKKMNKHKLKKLRKRLRRKT